MTVMEGIALAEKILGDLIGLTTELSQQGVIPADHPVNQQIIDHQAAISDAKALATASGSSLP